MSDELHPDAEPKPSGNHAAERAYLAQALNAEADAIRGVLDGLDGRAHAAVDIFERTVRSGGTILVAGMGKSGLVGKKISATMASLGAPSHDIHPAEAVHGDLGRIRRADCLLALSYSGETEEVVSLAAMLRQDGVSIVSIMGGKRGPESSLARFSTVALTIGDVTEACAETLAPTSSTTATLALGDALALALSRRMAFTANDFRKRHPGGGLGGLLRPVTEVLRFVVGQNLPVVRDDLTVEEALQQAAPTAGGLSRRPGAIILVNAKGALSGLFTDGDLRRLVMNERKHKGDPLARPIAEVMTRTPRTLLASALVRDAVHMVQEFRSDEIPVVDDQGRPVGVLDVQDLIALKVVAD
jgi:arabinose-5-phosphate isomerase